MGINRQELSGCDNVLLDTSATAACGKGNSDIGSLPTACEFNVDIWKGDLQRLHVTIETVVQSFIATQGRQLDAVAVELAAQKERISVKEQCFNELSDAIASFVEAEASKVEVWGVALEDAEADARHEAYDAELPGPPVLHRINRLWRKTTRAFEAMKEAKEREAEKTLCEERGRLEALVVAANDRCEALCNKHLAETETLRQQIESVAGDGEQKESRAQVLNTELAALTDQQAASEAAMAELKEQLEQADSLRKRTTYEWDAEREELARKRNEAESQLEEFEKAIEASKSRESELLHQCSEKGDKLVQMKRIMDEQEREMTTKIDRVQQYVKERQTTALQAEKKQQDSEKMADRWQREVTRLQAEKDRLAALVLDLEGHKSGQAHSFQGVQEQHQQEISRLQEALRRKDEEMRVANTELLQKRDEEYQTQVSAERQREKDRSIAMLRKKEQEVHIKDQQLKAARQRVQELESSSTGSTLLPSPSSRGSSAGRRNGSEASLPPLPLSAR